MSLAGSFRGLLRRTSKVPSDYKSTFTFQERQDALRDLLEKKRPNSIPIICERLPDFRSTMPSMPWREFTLPSYVTVASLLKMIRFRLKLGPAEALFVFFKGALVPTGAEMGSLFEEHRDEDGWMYVTYASENTFGG